MLKEETSVMVATLGGQPQVVTLALDALLARSENIREVIVLYLAGSRVNRALARLTAEFVNDQYAGRPCRLRAMPIRAGLDKLLDIQSNAEAEATQVMLRDLIIALKNERHHLHLCLSGGRRIMALVMMSVALVNLSYRDRVWHLYTPDEFQTRARDGAMMHAQPEDRVRLLQVPLSPLGTHFPALQRLTPVGQTDRSDHDPCREVILALSSREVEVLRAFASGLTPQAVAVQLKITLNTVNSHKKKILDECHNAWPDRPTLRYHHLAELFRGYFEL